MVSDAIVNMHQFSVYIESTISNTQVKDFI